MKGKRFAVSGLWQETNTFAQRPTTLEDFEAFEFVSGTAVAAQHKGVRSVIGGAVDSLGDSACFGLSAAAWPSGVITQATADVLLDRFEQDLRRAGSLDGMILNLHGAMVAEGISDIEAEVVSIARGVIGDAPIVAVLDLHANPSARLLENLNGVTAYRTFPHVDMYERGFEAGRMLRRMAQAESTGKLLFRKLPFITSPLSQGTADSPMRRIMEATVGWSGTAASFVTPGFPYSDVARAGLSIMVNVDAESEDAGMEALHSLTDLAVSQGQAFRISAISIEQAAAQLAATRTRTMLVDVGDNIGGGSDGSSTALLPILLSLPYVKSLFTFANAEVVRDAESVGVGGYVAVHFRDITGVDTSVDFEVIRIASGRYTAHGAWMGGHAFDMGTVALLGLKSTHVIATSVPVPPFHREQMLSQGLDPGDFEVLTAKGALAWQDAYGDFVETTIYVDTPGPTPAFPEDLPRTYTTDEASHPWEFPGGRELPDTA